MRTLIEIIKDEEPIKELQLSAFEDIRNLYRLKSINRIDHRTSLMCKKGLDLMYNYTTTYIKKKFNLTDVQIKDYINTK